MVIRNATNFSAAVRIECDLEQRALEVGGAGGWGVSLSLEAGECHVRVHGIGGVCVRPRVRVWNANIRGPCVLHILENRVCGLGC